MENYNEEIAYAEGIKDRDCEGGRSYIETTKETIKEIIDFLAEMEY